MDIFFRVAVAAAAVLSPAAAGEQVMAEAPAANARAEAPVDLLRITAIVSLQRAAAEQAAAAAARAKTDTSKYFGTNKSKSRRKLLSKCSC